MMTRHEPQAEPRDVWARLAAPLPVGRIAWRQDGRAIERDGKYFARFVCYVEANTVRERLDSVVPGEWNLTLDILPQVTTADPDGVDNSGVAFKARLQVLSVVREDVGMGRDYKAAATDAFKRAAVRFGIGHELYDMEVNWVRVDGDGKYPKPLEDPQEAYDRRHRKAANTTGDSRAEVQVGHSEQQNGRQPSSSAGDGEQSASTSGPAATSADVPPCPKCGGRMWDNRLQKRNPKAPDFKCRDRNCDGVIWPAGSAKRRGKPAEPIADAPPPELMDSDEIPF
jgi:hypothetical protein